MVTDKNNFLRTRKPAIVIMMYGRQRSLLEPFSEIKSHKGKNKPCHLPQQKTSSITVPHKVPAYLNYLSKQFRAAFKSHGSRKHDQFGRTVSGNIDLQLRAELGQQGIIQGWYKNGKLLLRRKGTWCLFCWRQRMASDHVVILKHQAGQTRAQMWYLNDSLLLLSHCQWLKPVAGTVAVLCRWHETQLWEPQLQPFQSQHPEIILRLQDWRPREFHINSKQILAGITWITSQPDTDP